MKYGEDEIHEIYLAMSHVSFKQRYFICSSMVGGMGETSKVLNRVHSFYFQSTEGT